METPYAAQTPTQSSTAQDDKKPSGFNPEENISIEQFEEAARKKYGIPKNLLQAMLQQESNGGQNLTSPTGVKGKYQVTQDVAEQWGKANGVSGADRNNPFHQAAAGMWYLRKNFDDTLDVPDTNARWLSAVGKYYGGPSAVKGGVADTISRDNVSNPAEHITRVGNYWKQLGLDGDSQEVPQQQQPVSKQEPAKQPATEVDETTALLQAIGAQEAAAPVEPTVTPGVAAGDAYKKYIESGTSTGFDKDIAEASILFSKPGQEAAKGFDPDKKVVYRIDPSTFPVDVVAKSKDRQKEFVHQYFSRLGLQPKQTDELIEATGWKLFDPKSLDDNLNNYLNGVQAALPLDISAGTAALVDAYKSGGAEAARVVKGQLDAFKLRFEQSKHVITDEERKSYAPLAAKVGANVAKMLGLPIGDRTLDLARGMMAMKMGAYQTAKENIQFWNNITGGIAFPKLAQQMQEGFQKNYALQNQIEKSMNTGESFLEQGVATSGMLLRNIAAGSLIAAATPVATSGAAVIAGTSGYNLFDTLISNLHESPEQRANAVVHQAILLGIPWGTKLGGSLLKGVLGKTASLTAGNIARASAAMKAAPLFSAAELGVATAGAAGYMGYSTKASGGTNEQAYAAALLGMALPVAMHMGSAAVNSIKGNIQQQAPLSQAQIDFNSLRPETQQHIIDMTAQGLRHPLVSNIIQTATAERAAQLGLNAEAVKMAFEAQEGLSERRLALGGLPVAIDPALRNQYRKVLEINAGLWAEYSINGLGAIGIASMPGNSVQAAALRAPIVSTTHQINETIKQEFGNSLYDPDVPGVSLPVEAAQQIATKLLGNPDSSVQKFAADLQRNVDRAKAENYDRVGLVNVEAPGEFSGEVAIHENIHGQTGKLVEGPVRQKAKAQSAQTAADLDLTEKLTKDLGEHRGAIVQQDIAKKVGNVVPIASEKPSSITVSGERFELNRGIKNTDVGDRILSGLLRNSVEAGKLKAKFRNAIESEGYYNDPEIAGMEEVYEPIARLTEQSFLKRHGIGAKEAEALVISELASFNTDAQGIRQLADHLPLSQRNAFLDFLNDPSTRKYETQGTTKTTVTPPSTVDTNVPPEGRGGSEKPVPSTPAPTTKPAEGRPVDTEAGIRPSTPEQTGTSAAKLETQRPSETGVRPEPKLGKPRKTPDIDVEPLAKTLEERSNTAKAEPEELRTRLRKLTQVASDPNAPQHVVDSAGRALARYGATREDLENLFRPPTEPQKTPEPAKTPVTDRFLEEYPQFKEKTPNEAVQEGITPEFNLDRSSVKTSQVQKTIENLERTFDGNAIPERTREYLRGAGVNVEKLERMLKGEAEPVAPKAAVPVSEPTPTKPVTTESKPIKPGDVKVGDRVFDASSLRYGTVTKVGAKTVKLTLERRPEDEGTLPITTESQYSRIAWNRYGDPVPVPPRPQEAKPISRGKIPAELVPELNSIRRQFQAGQIKPGDTITLSNGINVVAPRYENQFADVVGRKLAENSEAYGRTAQLIRAYWGRGNDNAVASIMDAFNLPGEPHTREAQDLVHRAVVKSFNNPKMSPEKVGALVQSEARAGKVPEEIGLSEIPSSDLYRWAKTRNLTEAFPPDIMSIGKDVDSKRKGNTVSLYSRDASNLRKGNQVSLYSRHQQETPEFKEWFGDSKVVDDKKKPLIVYHGTNSLFSTFRMNNAELGKGAYFTSSKKEAKSYGSNVKEVYLSIKNPQYFTGDYSEFKAQPGHDGVMARQSESEPYSEFVVYSPEQIKSTSNKGSFDPNNSNPLYSRKGVGVPDEGETHNVSRTSVKQVPELLRIAPIPEGSRNIDIGGGKYDLGVEALKERGVTSKVIDPYSRDAAHNAAVEAEYSKNPADTATVANVLNVIQDPAIRKSVIENAGKYVKDGGKIYFDVYEGNSKGIGSATKVGTWQENRKIATYVDEIKEVYPDARLVKNGSSRYIEATNSKDVPLYSRSPKDKAISHSNEALDGKKMIGRTADGRAIVPNPGNKSGVSIVKDQSFRETPTWDTSVPLYSRYGNGMNPKEAFQAKIAALYTEKNYENIPVNKKNEVRQAFSKAQAAWNKGDAKAFQEETFKAVYKLDEIIGETKNTAQKLAEIGVTAVRLNPLINAPARLADFTGTNVNVQTQVGTNPLKRFVGYIAETYIVPKAVKDKNVKDKRNTKLLEAEPITKTIPKIHAEDWMKGTGAGVLEGAKDAYEILKTGGSTFQLQTGMSYNFDRSQTGWVGSDKAINRIAGAVGNAPDAVARRISFDIIVRQFAREHSLQFPKNQQKAEFNKFYKNVPEEIIGLATALTEKYTYNNPNAAAEMIHTYIDKFAADGSKAALHHAANLAYRYVRVPTNVASQAVRITGVTGPGMMAWDVYQLYRNLFKSYDTNTGKFGMTLAERRIAIEKLTESTIGAMLMSGVALGALTFGTDNKYLNAIKNNVAGSYDENDPKAGKREEIRQIEPGAVRVPGTDRTVRPGALGPYQRVAQFQKDILKGTGYKGINEDEKLEASTAKDTVKSYGRAAANVAGTYPLVGGTKELMEGIFDDKGTDPARKIAESLTIGGAKDFGAYKDPIRRVTRKGSIWDNLKDNYGFGVDMPARVDSTGEPLKKRNIGSFFTKEYTTSPGIEEVDRLGLSFPNHKIVEKGNKLSVEEQAARAEYLGKLVKQAADKVVDSKEYKALASDEDKALVLNDTIQQINRNPDLTKDEAFHNARINAEFYKRREKLRANSSYAKMTVSQQQAAEKYLKTQFNKYSVTSEKKENDKADTFDLYMDFSDFLTSDFADAVEVAIEKASEKPRLPYERKK